MFVINVSEATKSIAVFHKTEITGVRTNVSLQVGSEYYMYGDDDEFPNQTSVHMFDYFMHEIGMLEQINQARKNLGLM